MRIYLKIKEYPEDTQIGNSKADIQKRICSTPKTKLLTTKIYYQLFKLKIPNIY